MFLSKYYRKISKVNCAAVSRLMILGNVAALTFAAGSAGSVSSGPCEVTVPDEWKPYLAVGELAVVGSPFYGVTRTKRSITSMVQINWSVRNLTSEPLELKVNYGSAMITDPWKTGFGVWYKLAPNEQRMIDNIYPVVSAVKSVRFRISMRSLRPAEGAQLDARYDGVWTEALPVYRPTNDNLVIRKQDYPHFVHESHRLRYSKDQGNVFAVKVTNETGQKRPLAMYVAVGDPNRFDIGLTDSMGRDVGPVAESITYVSANQTTEIELAYCIPQGALRPLLAFTLFEPDEQWLTADENDEVRHKIEPICWGWRDLGAASEEGLVKLPVQIPVEERANLSAQTKTDHFLLRYRLGSYAEQNIERIIKEREAAYTKLSSVLQMELRVTVTIDLYPDMEAKGLGSGTTWTAANTRSNKHICEVYNRAYQCDPYHELAHIFSYHFPNYSSNRGGIVEAFAAYFEPHNMPVGETRRILRRKLSEGQLDSMDKVLLSGGSSDELAVLIDFLLKKDVEKFKQFYVHVTRAGTQADMEKASREVYGTGLKALEEQWHAFINRGNETQSRQGDTL
jgi:hypothetical protein